MTREGEGSSFPPPAGESDFPVNEAEETERVVEG